jgi:concentrative nucleoside transporter, CNT family
MSIQNLVSFLGIFFFIFLAWIMSEDRRRFPWRVVGWGMALQFAFAFLVLWWEPGTHFFLKLNDVFNALLGFARQGSSFVFNSLGSDQIGGPGMTLKEYLTRLGANSPDPVIQDALKTGLVPGTIFAFQVLTTIIFFSALLSVLYYLGIMQKVVMFFARIMAHTMRVSGAEALSNSANIFVGQTEAPLVVRPYLEKMTRSELMAIMVGGFANTAGGVLGAYILMLVGFFPNIAAHLISASVLSAPAAFIIAKIMVPEREEPLTRGDIKLDAATDDANLLDAAANGSTVGWQLAINVAAMLISFVALIAMANLFVSWIGNFFYNTSGLVQFNVMVAAAVLSLVLVQRAHKLDAMVVWYALGIVALVYLAAVAVLSPTAARVVGLTGIAFWLPLLFVELDRPLHTRTPQLVLIGLILAADLAFFAAGPLAATTKLSLQMILGWVHWPVAFIMGTPVQDCLTVGRMLGEKLILTEFLAYADLSSTLAAASRGEIPRMDPRSIVVVSYALSGFANFASIAIQIGGIAPLAPSRRSDIARLGFKAMIGGAITSYLLACVAGAFYSGSSMLGVR